LRLAEDGVIGVVLSDFILSETRRVIKAKFSFLVSLLDLFLSRIRFDMVSGEDMRERLCECVGVVRDGKDVPVLAAVLVSGPDYVLTGDVDLRDDLNEYFGAVKAVSTGEFLSLVDRRLGLSRE